jgi:hypothetical protein
MRTKKDVQNGSLLRLKCVHKSNHGKKFGNIRTKMHGQIDVEKYVDSEAQRFKQKWA